MARPPSDGGRIFCKGIRQQTCGDVSAVPPRERVKLKLTARQLTVVSLNVHLKQESNIVSFTADVVSRFHLIVLKDLINLYPHVTAVKDVELTQTQY